MADAEQQAVELLHTKCFVAALEGELEPVLWKGQVIGHIKKYDSRLQIEMLRAHMPDKFKMPGSRPNISNSRPPHPGIVIGAKELAELRAMRQESLRLIAEKKGAGQSTAR